MRLRAPPPSRARAPGLAALPAAARRPLALLFVALGVLVVAVGGVFMALLVLVAFLAWVPAEGAQRAFAKGKELWGG